MDSARAVLSGNTVLLCSIKHCCLSLSIRRSERPSASKVKLAQSGNVFGSLLGMHNSKEESPSVTQSVNRSLFACGYRTSG